MKTSIVLYIILLIMVIQPGIFAQSLSEPLTNGNAELGYSHYWHKGDFYWDPATPTNEDSWTNGTIYFRIGLYDIVTFSVEAMLLPVTSSSNYPGESYLNYTFGIALSSPTLDFYIFDLFINIHYLDNLYLDRSEQKNDKRFRDIDITVPVRYRFLNQYSLWIGPFYNWNAADYFEDQTNSQDSQSLGFSFGADALLFDHIYLNLNIRYLDKALPNIVVGYRF